MTTNILPWDQPSSVLGQDKISIIFLRGWHSFHEVGKAILKRLGSGKKWGKKSGIM